MEEHQTIGESLRRRREERGLSVEQAAFQSKVPLRLLQALESDDYRLLPDPFYLIRLLWDYASFLKLDAAALEEEFQQTLRRLPKPTLAISPAGRPAPVIAWRQVVWTVVAILVVTPLVFIALSLASKRASERPVPPPAATETAEESQQVNDGGQTLADRMLGESAANGTATESAEGELEPGSPGPVPRAPVMPAPVMPAPATAGPAAAGGGVTEQTPRRYLLVVRAKQLTWMSVRADGRDPRRVLLKPDEGARFSADDRFVMTVGNAGGITLWLNGSPLPPLGKSGEVIRDLVLPPAQRGGAGPVTPP